MKSVARRHLAAVPPSPIDRMREEGCWPDDIASVIAFASGTVPSLDLGAEERTPWDEQGGDYYGGDAA